MKYLVILAVLVTLVFGAVGTAEAVLFGLIGDDGISIAHYFPNLSSWIAGTTTTVQAGTGDQWTLDPYYIVNPEDTSILVNFIWPYEDTFWSNAAFNGLVISGIDATLTGVTVDTNLTGWDNSRLSFDDHYVRFNWQGLYFQEEHFYAYLDFGELPPVPEPATMSLLGFGLLGFAHLRKRKRR